MRTVSEHPLHHKSELSSLLFDKMSIFHTAKCLKVTGFQFAAYLCLLWPSDSIATLPWSPIVWVGGLNAVPPIAWSVSPLYKCSEA